MSSADCGTPAASRAPRACPRVSGVGTVATCPTPSRVPAFAAPLARWGTLWRHGPLQDRPVWTGIGSALGLGLGIGISRWATSDMQDGDKRANIVLG